MKKEEIRERVEQLSIESLVEVWNEYQNENSGDDVIYSIAEFDEICFHMTPSEIAENVCGGEFDLVDDYFIITPYGFESFPIWDAYKHVYIDELVDWFAEDETRLEMI